MCFLFTAIKFQLSNLVRATITVKLFILEYVDSAGMTCVVLEVIPSVIPMKSQKILQVSYHPHIIPTLLPGCPSEISPNFFFRIKSKAVYNSSAKN